MLRLITFATHQQTQEMSFLRRLICYSRYILRNHQILLGRRKVEVSPENQSGVLLRTEGKKGCNIIVGGGNVGTAGPRASSELGGAAGRSSTDSGGSSFSSSTLSRIGQQIHTQVRQIFINNVLRRATTNQEVARKAAQRLLYGDSRPFFALVGVSLATGSVGVVSQDSEFDGICWEIRESISRQTKESNMYSSSSSIEFEPITSVSDLKFGPILNQGCNAAVYAANYKDSTEAEWVLAVKMMFNYDIESNAFSILKGMVKEIVPARQVDLKNLAELDKSLFENVKRCPPHQNIIDIHHAFVDKIPLLEGLQRYPNALPQRLNPDAGFGRNMSLFLVMKRYDTNLQDYLKNTDLTHRTRMLIFTQILSGVSHLVHAEIAHRDLKTDNILVDVSQGYMFPEIVISDFGCCLADKSNGLSLPFRTEYIDRGGNAALTAPEISTAVPGAWKYLNYKNSDAWTCGAIAYEIFGNPNPFYGENHLDGRTYTDNDLPTVNHANPIVQKLIKGLLKRNPDQRISAEKAFNICILLLWAPSDWMVRSGGRCPNDDDILQWLVCLTAKALSQTNEILEFKIMRSFLKKVKFSSLKSAVVWIAQSQD